YAAVDFTGNKVKAFRNGIPWPEGTCRRASINSFGVGGSNAHVIMESPGLGTPARHVSSYITAGDGFAEPDDDAPRPFMMVSSANDPGSLRNSIQSLSNHLINPRVKVKLPDLAYTLSEHRTKFWHRAFITTQNTELDERLDDWTVSKKGTQGPSVGFIFTGQGAQWPQMGRDLLRFFPWTRDVLRELDAVLHALKHAPSWSLIRELTEPRPGEHPRQPEFSQPLVTALQICIVDILMRWDIRPRSVVGHSSGEIAAAYAAGLLDRASAITAAYYRGKAATLGKVDFESKMGMLAVATGADEATGFLQHYTGQAWIACFNSPNSVTISGKLSALEALCADISSAGHFARLLHVDMAYHTELMDAISGEYENLLNSERRFQAFSFSTVGEVSMFSSVTESKQTTPTSAAYWKQNMSSAVRFDSALRAMLSDRDTAPNFLVEIGPSGALAGPVSQVLKSMRSTVGGEISYCSAWSRGANAGNSLFAVAGRLWAAGNAIDLAVVNEYNGTERTIVDLPNYSWDHSVKHWHENASSKDWRFRKYLVHDLLGSKVLGTSWKTPTWRSRLNVANLPYLMDHRMGGNAIMPGAGFVTMAIEAIYQKHCACLSHGGDDTNEIVRNDLCYRFRNLRFSKALVLEEGRDMNTIFTLTAAPGSDDWHNFTIFTAEGETVSEHCSGSIRIQDPVNELAEGEDALPLKSPQASKLWYKSLRELGMDFGPAFQRFIKIEPITEEPRSSALVSLDPSEGKFNPQSQYPIHPAALDGCFQTSSLIVSRGDRTKEGSVLIPGLIDDLVVNKVPSCLRQGRAKAFAVYSGRGRRDQPKNWKSNTTVYDAESGQLVMRITGMKYAELDVAIKPDPHTFHSVVWKPDISCLTCGQVNNLAKQVDSSKLETIIDLIAFKKPSLQVLELNIEESDTSCLWFDNGDSPMRAAYLGYFFGSTNGESLFHVEALYRDKGDVSFGLVSTENPTLHLPSDICYDLVIIKAPGTRAAGSVNKRQDRLRPLLNKNSFTVLVDIEGNRFVSTEVTGPGNLYSSGNQHQDTDTISTASHISSYGIRESSPTISFLSGVGQVEQPSSSPAQLNGSQPAIEIAEMDNRPFAYLLKTGNNPCHGKSSPSPKIVVIASLSPSSSDKIPPSLQAVLEDSGWTTEYQIYPFPKPASGEMVVILDELWDPVLTKVDSIQWEAIKTIISWGRPLLWVTQGAQGRVSNPDKAMVHGLFRVARQEDPNVILTTLDVLSSTSPEMPCAVERVLGLLRASDVVVEHEYMEREGILHVQRIMPDDDLNHFRRTEQEGMRPIVKGLHSAKVPVSLRVEHLGTLQSLVWCEAETGEVLHVGAGLIEVEVMATGVNFKDIAITMGIVTDDKYNLGFECAGTVTRLGPGADKFRVGDRVCMLRYGCYANRVLVPVDRCHVIPDSMTFVEAASIPTTYLCSLYAMYHMGELQEGQVSYNRHFNVYHPACNRASCVKLTSRQSVLIHSAAGGIGITCIELALHKKAEIFITVGTEEKRQFLETKYGIPRSHMFSSRNADFAAGIMKVTRGRGVNVILDASWRILADGGNMVEIGKRDILDRNTLSMEPFDRNCSFRAIDMSYTKHVDDELIARLFDELFVLLNGGKIKPIEPITTFGYDDMVSALSLIRSGRHLGKIVISNVEQQDVQLPIRPAVRRLWLDPHVSYLIVGGLRGACGTLAIHLAQHGARHIIVNNRTGIRDELSMRIVSRCKEYRCAVTGAQGDVCDMSFVRGLFKSASPRIAGIIQGAMVLRMIMQDKPLELMTLDDYHTAISAKVMGTKNLHQASEDMQCSLHFFVMLSSTSGIVGNKGQGNYAAANTFLDAFASYRESLGLRANTVNLGVIQDVGYVAEQGSILEARIDTRMWTPIGERMLRKILTYSILQQDNAAPINAHTRTQLITGVSYLLPISNSIIVPSRIY
ncbi:unnamed protein product, partial [Clonostachys rhizophaga]